MWSKLFGASSARSKVLDQAVQDFLAMIDHDHWMFQRAGAVLWDRAEVEPARAEIYERDILVNKTERAIRKAIVSHLAVNPRSDTVLCLILMSVGKDAERIGDYCKNMMDLPDYHLPRAGENAVADELQRMQGRVDALFPLVRAGFGASDEVAGGEVVRQEREVTEACEALIQRVLDFPGLSTRQAVSYTLLARFYKRIAAHLGNIASSLVMPLHKLDYFDERYLRSAEASPGDD